MKRNTKISVPLIACAILACLAPSHAIAHETGVQHPHQPSPQNPLQFIRRLGPFGFQGAQMNVPPHVLGAMKQGLISPIMQFVLLNHTMNSCITRVIHKAPPRRVSYQNAKRIFDMGLCEIQSCFKQAMLISMLPGMSPNPAFGGSRNPHERETNQVQAQAYLSAFSKDAGCDSNGQQTSGGISPILLQLLQGGTGAGQSILPQGFGK